MRESLDQQQPLYSASRTHLFAVMKNVSAFARAARQIGIVDKAGLEESLDRLNEFLRTSGVLDTLKDFQAESLYDASVGLSAAFKAAAATGDLTGPETKAAFGRACEALRKFWVSMGEVPAAD